MLDKTINLFYLLLRPHDLPREEQRDSDDSPNRDEGYFDEDLKICLTCVEIDLLVMVFLVSRKDVNQVGVVSHQEVYI